MDIFLLKEVQSWMGSSIKLCTYLQLDVQNGKTKWMDAIDLEIEWLKENPVCKDHGEVTYEKGKIMSVPK